MNTALNILSSLAQAAPGTPQTPSPLASLMPLIFIGIIFYFLLIRPQQKQRKEHQKLIESLKTGDNIITNAGIHGRITNVKEKTVIVKVDDNVKIEFDKASIVTRESNSES